MSATYTKDNTRFEFRHETNGWSVTSVFANTEFAATGIDFSPIPGAPSVQQLEELFKFPSSITLEGSRLTLTFKVGPFNPIAITMTRNPEVNAEEELVKLQLYVAKLEEALYSAKAYIPDILEKMTSLYPDRFYTATVMIKDSKVTFIAEKEENDGYVQAFMKAWEDFLCKRTLTKGDDDLIRLEPEVSQANNGRIRYKQKGCKTSTWSLASFRCLSDTATETGWHPWLEASLESVKKAHLEGIISPTPRNVIFLNGDHKGRLNDGHVIARLLLRKQPQF